VGTVIAVHGRPDSLAMGENRDGFDLPLCRLELVVPNAYDFIHGRRRGGELLFCAVVVEHCVIVGKEGVLDLDLCREEVR
jgi:hypothetical protein